MKRNNVVLRERSMVLRRRGRLRLLGRFLFVLVIVGTGRSGTAFASDVEHVPFGHGGAVLGSSTGSAVRDAAAGTRTHFNVSAPRRRVDSARDNYRSGNRSMSTTLARCVATETGAGEAGTGAKGAPNSSGVRDNGNGKGQIRDYGTDGKAETDYDFGHDHGAGDPHAHEWDWTKTPPGQPGRPIRPGEGARR